MKGLKKFVFNTTGFVIGWVVVDIYRLFTLPLEELPILKLKVSLIVPLLYLIIYWVVLLYDAVKGE